MLAHKKLSVWKESMDLVESVYMLTSSFPKSEIFGLTSQIRRAAVSVPANISEGSARKSSKEFHYFLTISFGSLTELETLLIIAKELQYINDDGFSQLHQQIRVITTQLSNLIHAIEKKYQG